MKILVRVLLSLAFFGSCYWAYKDIKETEPYITAIVSFAAFIGSFIKRSKKIKLEPLINVELITVGQNSQRLVFSNTSNEDAYDINLPIKENPDHPVLEDVYKRTFPIKIIYATDHKEVLASATLDANEFNLTWHWKNKKGKSFSRENIVTLKS